MIGFLAPSISESFGLEVRAFAPVFAAGLVGLMVGALLLGPIADKIGRRWLVIVSTFAFGVFTFLTASANTIDEFVILRFLTGLGLGGAMPNLTALATEYSPRRYQAMIVRFLGFVPGRRSVDSGRCAERRRDPGRGQARLQVASARIHAPPGTKMADIAIDRVFIDSYTNGRIGDLRAAAAVIGDRKAASTVSAMVVTGSGLVEEQAETEGLDKIFKDAGFEWREPGCSMCLAMNDDRLKLGERCASTSNRNLEGRQGYRGRTHLVSPAMPPPQSQVTSSMCGRGNEASIRGNGMKVGHLHCRSERNVRACRYWGPVRTL